MTGMANPGQGSGRPGNFANQLRYWLAAGGVLHSDSEGPKRVQSAPLALRVREGWEKTIHKAKGRFFPHLPTKPLILRNSRTISSESRLFNGLRGFFAEEFFAGLFPTLRGAATGAYGRAMRKRRIIHGASLTWLPIFRKRLSSASFPLRPPQSTGNSLSAAQRNGGSRSCWAGSIRSRSSITPPPAPGARGLCKMRGR